MPEWNTLSRLCRSNLPQLANRLTDVRVAHASRTLHGPLAHDVITTVDHEEQAAALPLWQQGNLDMQQVDNLRLRFALRRHPLVLSELHEWWATAQRALRLVESDDWWLTRDQYVRVFTNVFAVLAEDDFDDATVADEAGQAWAIDSAGGDRLSRSSFLDAVFELADVWTKGVTAEEYASFLTVVRSCVTRPEEGGPVWANSAVPGAAHAQMTGAIEEEEEEGEGGEGGEEEAPAGRARRRVAPTAVEREQRRREGRAVRGVQRVQATARMRAQRRGFAETRRASTTIQAAARGRRARGSRTTGAAHRRDGSAAGGQPGAMARRTGDEGARGAAASLRFAEVEGRTSILFGAWSSVAGAPRARLAPVDTVLRIELPAGARPWARPPRSNPTCEYLERVRRSKDEPGPGRAVQPRLAPSRSCA